MDTSAARSDRARRRRAAALSVLRTLDLQARWRRCGDPVVVGSVALDLVVEPDIDLEIYSDAPSVAEGFAVLTPCAELPGVRRLRFNNALDLDDHGLYWRLDYEVAGGETWQIDMWWLPGDHPGPRAADLVGPLNAALTDETRDAVLSVKEGAAAAGEPLPGVRVYQAVLDHGVRTYPEFVAWRARTPTDGLTSWLPAGPRR
ncbi:hypothetical protein [Streptomyces sp. 8L]|uniref:hypothetical protein n=1 Tax=Streptomyces sp. 8L TaxID=2877242 RepID=UPI001CD3076B|nr:hypothetical protein [Streptomyces sp. 8L]MCA1222801.1 hypothetical protein [Streptomyces sp. 8L]